MTLLQAFAIKEFETMLEASYDLIIDLYVEETQDDEYVLVAKGFSVKAAEDRVPPPHANNNVKVEVKIHCRPCYFMFW